MNDICFELQLENVSRVAEETSCARVTVLRKNVYTTSHIVAQFHMRLAKTVLALRTVSHISLPVKSRALLEILRGGHGGRGKLLANSFRGWTNFDTY